MMQLTISNSIITPIGHTVETLLKHYQSEYFNRQSSINSKFSEAIRYYVDIIHKQCSKFKKD